MYYMKNIISHDCEMLLPNCMYHVKNPNELVKSNETDKIYNQVIKLINKGKSPNMTELEHRQNQLICKLDNLYERIKAISLICSAKKLETKLNQMIAAPDELVLNINSDHLPWYLNIFLKDAAVNVSWHIHSSVPHDKTHKIKAFVKDFKITAESKINLRLIFKCVSIDSDLKFSSLAIPIVGSVNILRYLSLVYPNIVPYDIEDYKVEALLDNFYILEKTTDKNKETNIQKLFAESKDWIYNNKFSIVDVAAYSVIKQMRGIPKSVPKQWFDKCEKIIL